MVNFEKVKVIRRDKDGLKLGFDNQLVSDIPVSKTYINPVMETFSRYSQTTEIS
jgi:DNA-binding LytR/AlgR family response regulator